MSLRATLLLAARDRWVVTIRCSDGVRRPYRVSFDGDAFDLELAVDVMLHAHAARGTA
jgi:hypothetical protein